MENLTLNQKLSLLELLLMIQNQELGLSENQINCFLFLGGKRLSEIEKKEDELTPFLFLYKMFEYDKMLFVNIEIDTFPKSQHKHILKIMELIEVSYFEAFLYVKNLLKEMDFVADKDYIEAFAKEVDSFYNFVKNSSDKKNKTFADFYQEFLKA